MRMPIFHSSRRSAGPHSRYALLLACWLVAAASSAGAAESRAPAAVPAGTILPATPVQAAGSAVVNFADLARRDARAPTVTGPLVPILVPEGEEPPEPEGPPGSVILEEVQPSAPPGVSPVATTSFIGLDDIPLVGTGSIIIPPDTDGAVGLSKIMEGLNNNYRILDKTTGATLSTVSITTFWTGLGAAGLFDPKTLYDPINNRWIVVAMSDAATAGSSVVLGVSLTSDPSGSYFLYRFDVDAGNTLWADFPTVGFNKNWVAVNMNMFTNAGNAYSASKCLVVDYALLRSGALSSGVFFAGTGFCSSPSATYSSTENTLYAPTHFSSNSATYRLDTITGAVATPAYTIGVTKTRPGGGWTQPGGNILPQAAPLSGASVCSPLSLCFIDVQDAQIRSSPVFRGGSIYYTQTVGIPAGGLTHTGVQWTRLDAATGNVLDGGRLEDPTATSSNGGKWYAYPHIAVNAAGDFVVGFSQFSSSQFGAGGYAVHLAADGAGTLRTPLIHKSGEDYYHKTFSGTRNRWGDYSKAQVDPTDDQTLWVLQEYAKARTGTDDGTGGTNSSKWGTWWAGINGPPTVTIDAGPSHNEGDAGLTAFDFTARLSNAYGFPLTVNYQTANGTATVADNDYQAATSSIVVPAISTTGTITVNAVGDTKRESAETFTVGLTSVSDGTIGAPAAATGTILNDDATPSLAINDVAMPEGESGTSNATFTVTLSNLTDQGVTVDYQSADGTATLLDNDYQNTTGTLTIPANSISGPIAVPVNGDLTPEPDETFVVNLLNPANASITDNQGQGTIQRDEAVGVGEEPVSEFSLRRVVPNPASGPVHIDYSVARETRVRVGIVDLQGRTVATLVDGVRVPGRYHAVWDGGNSEGRARAGLYFVRYQAAGRTWVRRVLMVR